jgi:hypothetical protein
MGDASAPGAARTSERLTYDLLGWSPGAVDVAPLECSPLLYLEVVGDASSSTLRDATPVEPARALEAAEHVATILRLRGATGPGCVLWMLSIAFDFGNAAHLAPGSFPALAGLRFLGGAIVAAVWLRMRAKRRPSPRELRTIAVAMFTSVSAIFGGMAVAASGITSPYFGGAMIVLVVYGAVISDH